MSNSRVTNRQLADKIDSLKDDISQYRIATEKRITHLETCLPQLKRDLDKKANKEVVDNLKRRDYIIGGINAVGAVIGSIFGINN